MEAIEKRSGHYRLRYRDPLGRQHSKTFIRKADAVALPGRPGRPCGPSSSGLDNAITFPGSPSRPIDDEQLCESLPLWIAGPWPAWS